MNLPVDILGHFGLNLQKNKKETEGAKPAWTESSLQVVDSLIHILLQLLNRAGLHTSVVCPCPTGAVK